MDMTGGLWVLWGGFWDGFDGFVCCRKVWFGIEVFLGII
jgi:hypothetical protein